MKTSLILNSIFTYAAIAAIAPATRADSYTVQLLGFGSAQLIANQLDHGSNTLNELFPSMPVGTELIKWDCAHQDWDSNPIHAMESGWERNETLAPGEGAMLITVEPGLLQFAGNPHVPVLPVSFPCGRGKMHLLSCQTNMVGTFENITGLAPREGDQLLRWDPILFDYQTNTFTGGVWVPSTPSVPIGEAVMIIRAVQSVATNSIDLSWSFSSGQLTLAWPSDHIGWELEAQTNGLDAGLNTNWFAIPGSTSTNQLMLPMDPANGCVLYRLRYTP